MEPVMKVSIEQIREGGLDQSWPLSREALDALLAEESGRSLHATGATEVKAHFERIGEKVLLKVLFPVEVEGECKRCLAETAVQETVAFTLTLTPHGGRPSPSASAKDKDKAKEKEKPKSGGGSDGEESGQMDLDEADEEAFSGHEIDVSPFVREQLLLALPMDLLCKESCRGLCPVCGQDRNQTPCTCETQRIDPRWEALKQIKLS